MLYEVITAFDIEEHPSCAYACTKGESTTPNDSVNNQDPIRTIGGAPVTPTPAPPTPDAAPPTRTPSDAMRERGIPNHP